jgi:hypothetical protein
MLTCETPGTTSTSSAAVPLYCDKLTLQETLCEHRVSYLRTVAVHEAAQLKDCRVRDDPTFLTLTLGAVFGLV